MSTNTPSKKHHGVQIASACDIYENVYRESNQAYGLFEAVTSIVCAKEDGQSVEFKMKACAYGSVSLTLKSDHVYLLKSRLLAPNTKEIQSFYYEQDHAILACDSESFLGTMANNTAVTGLGIITERKEIFENNADKATVSSIIRHSDYDPVTKSMVSFTIEYRCQPTRNLTGMQRLFQIGREAQVTGFIIGWDEDASRWIVNVNGIYLTSGSESTLGLSSAAGPSNPSKTATGRARGAFYRPPEDSPPPNSGPLSNKDEDPDESMSVIEEPEPGPSSPPKKKPRKAKAA